MDLLLVVALILPLVGAAAMPLAGRFATDPVARGVGIGAAVAAALAWAVIITAEVAPTLGRIEPEPLAAASVAGLAWLVAVRLPSATVLAITSLCAVSVFAVAATTGSGQEHHRALAVGVAVLCALAVVRLRSTRARRFEVLAVGAGGVALTAGLLLDEALGGVVAVAGAALAVVGLTTAAGGAVLLPVVLVASARASESGQAAVAAGDTDVVGIASVVAAVVAAALVVFVCRRHRDHQVTASSSRTVAGLPARALPAAPALAALVLLGQSLPDLRAAGVLLAAGAVLASGTSVPLGLVACLPGLAATMEAFGDATDVVHAAAGAAVVLVLGGVIVLTHPPAVDGTVGHRLSVVPPVVFAVLPVWSWTGADLDGYGSAVAVGGAASLLVAAAIALAAVVPDVRRPRLGSLRDRPVAAHHASTHPRAEEADPEEGDPEKGDAVQEGRSVAPEAGAGARPGPQGAAAGAQAQPAVARPPGAVPGGPAGRGRRGGGRLRGRPGGTA